MTSALSLLFLVHSHRVHGWTLPVVLLGATVTIFVVFIFASRGQ